MLNTDTLSHTDFTLAGAWRLLLRRRMIAAIILLLSVLVGVGLAFRRPIFEASGSLQVRVGSANMYKVDASALAEGMEADDKIESEVSILQSRSLLIKVADDLRLASDSSIMGKFASSTATMQDPYVQARVLRALDKMIEVRRIPKTEIIKISCKSTSPKLAARIVATLMNDYVERVFETRYQSSQRAAQFLNTQLESLKNQVLADQEKLIDLQGKLGVMGFDDSHNLVTAQLEELAKANQEANIERIVAEARYRSLEGESPELVEGGPPMLAQNPQTTTGTLLQSLRNSQAQLSAQYANQSEQFGPNLPDTKRLKAELDEVSRQVAKEQERVVSTARTSFQAAKRNEAMTAQSLAAEKRLAFQKRNDMVAYQLLLHDYQSSRTLYEGLMQRLKEAGVVSGLESGEIEIVDLPSVPVIPTSHSPVSVFIATLLLGTIVAFMAALLADGLDTKVHSAEDLEQYLQIPALAIIPEASLRARKGIQGGVPPSRLETLLASRGGFIEGIRLLKSSILLSSANMPPKVIAITSCMPQEGKSTISASTASVFAQGGSKVLLIDCDLHRPTQHILFGLPNVRGLSDILTGNDVLSNCVARISKDSSPDILTSGPLPPSPGRLIPSQAMQNLLAECRSNYDIVIIDTPPSLAISDTAGLVGLVDVVCLIVRDGASNRRMIRRAYATLVRLGATIPGFILNGIDRRSTDYYDYKNHYEYSSAAK